MAYSWLVEFVWDGAKDRSNRRKHGISFAEASELFLSGVNYLEVFDEAHSAAEDRFPAIGPIQRGVIVVVYTELRDEVLRIIGARPASKREVEWYQAAMEVSG